MLKRRGPKSLNSFKFGTFIGRFPSDGAASMTAKGLMADTLKDRASHNACIVHEFFEQRQQHNYALSGYRYTWIES